MSIVTPEASVYPETLLEQPTAESSSRRWWALYTKSRQEKAIARQLLGLEVPFYLPLVKKRSVCRGRRISSRVPLFPGYVFLFGTEEERVLSLTTNRISRILPVVEQVQLRKELRQLRHLIGSGAPLTVETRLCPGDYVRVRHGPFAGLEGTVLRRQGLTRLVVSINFLKQGASVEIDDVCLEPIEKPDERRPN